MKKMLRATTILLALAGGAVAQSSQIEGSYEVAFAGCGWYIVLGCSGNFNAMAGRMDNLGGPFAGGGAGLKVANTNEYPNFRNGFFCVVDGPYVSQSAAQSIAWAEAVPDAYVKSGC